MLKAASQANGVRVRGSDVLAPNALFQSGTIETGSLSALRVRFTVTAFLRSAPALRNGSALTKNNASAKRPAALAVRNNNCLAIGLPPTCRNNPLPFQTRKRPPTGPRHSPIQQSWLSTVPIEIAAHSLVITSTAYKIHRGVKTSAAQSCVNAGTDKRNR